jgi:peptidoglycan/LPS O-acetylase OafA/YrhL
MDDTTMAKAPTKPCTHLPALDGLRGVAILAVLVFHFAPYIAETNPVTVAINHGRRAAWCGVDLFFVLSGFLITGILLDAKRSPHYFRNFYARRTLRIFPLYFGVLLAAAALATITGGPTPVAETNLADRPFWLWTYGTNIAVALKGTWSLHYHGLSVSHFWSLAVEEHFYLLWPAVVLLLRPRGLALVCTLCIVGAVALRIAIIGAGGTPLTVYVLTPCRLDALALGGLLALLARSEGGLASCRRPAMVVALIGGAIALTVFALGGGDVLTPDFHGTTAIARATQLFVATVGYTVLALVFAAVLILAISNPGGWLARTCECRFLRFFGTYSYGLYVYHEALEPLFDRWLPRQEWVAALHSTTAAGLAIMVIKSLLAVSIAVVSWNLFEKPILRLKRYFEYRETPEWSRESRIEDRESQPVPELESILDSRSSIFVR